VVIAGGNAAGLAKNGDGIAVCNALMQIRQKGTAPTLIDPVDTLLALRTLNLGAAAKPHVVNRYTITLAASELVRYTPLRDGAEEPNTISGHKLLSGFFLRIPKRR
jgi:hypothetical protein